MQKMLSSLKERKSEMVQQRSELKEDLQRIPKTHPDYANKKAEISKID